MAHVLSVDYALERIFLHPDTVTQGFSIIEAHKEIELLTSINANNEQNYLNPTFSEGGIPKGGGTFTARFGIVRAGWRLVPYDSVSHELDITVEILSQDGVSDQGVFDRAPLPAGIEVDIDTTYSQVEVIQIVSGSGVTAQDKVDIATQSANAVWTALRAAGWPAGSFGAVSEYTGVPPAAAPTTSEIATAVMTAVLSNYAGTVGSLAAVVTRVLALMEADVRVSSIGTVLQIYDRTTDELLLQKNITGGDVVDVDLDDVVTPDPPSLAELQVYSLTDGPLAADPSSLVASAVDEADGWIRITMAADGASVVVTPADSATYRVPSPRDQEGNTLAANTIGVEDQRLLGLDVDGVLPTGVVVGIGWIDTDAPATAAQVNGALIYFDGTRIRVETQRPPFVRSFARDVGIDARRIVFQTTEWTGAAGANIRTLAATALDASGARLQAQVDTGTPAYVNQSLVWWVGRTTAGLGGESFRIRPWSIIRRIAPFLRSF